MLVNSNQQHIAFVRLADFADQRLSKDDRAEIEQHLADCPRCTADVTWLRRVIDLMRTDIAQLAPPSAVAAAKALFRRPTSRRHLRATLRFDSLSTPIAMGMRSAGQADRQLLFATDDLLVDLRIAASGELWAVSGQLLGAEAGEQVELRGSAAQASAALNEMSEFALPPAPAGSYDLVVQLADADITITGLELGA